MVKTTKSKKCDYCDEYANYKLKEDAIYKYLCINCSKNTKQAQEIINQLT